MSLPTSRSPQNPSSEDDDHDRQRLLEARLSSDSQNSSNGHQARAIEAKGGWVGWIRGVTGANADHELTPTERRKQLLGNKVRYVGACYAVCYVGMNVAGSYTTAVFGPDTGLLALALLNSCFGIGSLLAPSASVWIGGGAARSMFLSATTFPLYILAITLGHLPLHIVASTLYGFGIGLMWFQQGVYINRAYTLAGGFPGFFSGKFYQVFTVNGVVGNILALILFRFKLGLRIVLWTMLAITCAGLGMFWFVDSLEEEDCLSGNIAFGGDSKTSESKTGGAGAYLMDVIKTARSRVERSHKENGGGGYAKLDLENERTTDSMVKEVGNETEIPPDHDLNLHRESDNESYESESENEKDVISGGRFSALMNFTMGVDRAAAHVPLVNLCGAAAGWISSNFAGPAFDKQGWKLLVAVHAAALLLNYGVVALELAEDDHPSWKPDLPGLPEGAKEWLFLFNGAMFGLADNLMATVRDASVVLWFSAEEARSVFALSRFCYCLGYAIVAFLSPILSTLQTMILHLSLYAVVVYIYHHGTEFVHAQHALNLIDHGASEDSLLTRARPRLDHESLIAIKASGLHSVLAGSVAGMAPKNLVHVLTHRETKLGLVGPVEAARLASAASLGGPRRQATLRSSNAAAVGTELARGEPYNVGSMNLLAGVTTAASVAGNLHQEELEAVRAREGRDRVNWGMVKGGRHQ
ncbi:hypothetical protein HDU93_003783 [Gonapodya sp. JEL0774]|nr:hypothetical protein HDU93_003783 [Gonapodya sp. JEL0774]